MMNHAALTVRYRPQSFAEVSGQSLITAVLSRAAAEDRVAPAYLFSGTRGVGKTTLARIFAKALNCRKAPAAEPCNACDRCRAITLGGAVDVLEIDAASNRGIDDVRRLKESVGYAPLDARYKVFIIDEAHMLTPEAFNALLKTLEEPPSRATFILATTEPHKIPSTILSRCQHYVFKRLSDAELEAHLKKLLALENIPYEDAALRLLTRRAGGSVRDSMSLLGQVLALGKGSLAESDVRSMLGLAGQEFFLRLLSAIKKADCPALLLLVRELLDQGLDLGFFLRELGSMWRNLFMLRQTGKAAGRAAALPETELDLWMREAEGFDLGHIHACWQMSLEGQHRVLTSLDPALSLELLLLNLALLPRMLSLREISVLSRSRKGAISADAPADAPADVSADVSGPAPEAPGENGHALLYPEAGPEEPEVQGGEQAWAEEARAKAPESFQPPEEKAEKTGLRDDPEERKKARRELEDLPLIRAFREKLDAEIVECGYKDRAESPGAEKTAPGSGGAQKNKGNSDEGNE
jgi:DNA polymerase-3 subunit gamma/tau